ncbi:hypothetical protein [Campylobacter phage CJLB-12]|nr:hypothetical protein [Campylobacter phage CJLB-12]
MQLKYILSFMSLLSIRVDLECDNENNERLLMKR